MTTGRTVFYLETGILLQVNVDSVELVEKKKLISIEATRSCDCLPFLSPATSLLHFLSWMRLMLLWIIPTLERLVGLNG